MANDIKVSVTARNAELDALAVLANSGKLRIYDGSKPATADTAIGAQVKLAELTMNATAFGAAASGVITANAITSDTAADATGTASWFRLLKSDGTTALWDGTVGTSGSDMNLNSTAIQVNAQVSVTALTLTLPA